RELRAGTLDNVGSARGNSKQVHDPRRVEPERAAERESLAERLPIDHERHVDGELHHRARADWAAMFEPAAKLLQDRLRARGVGALSSHQADQLALPGRAGRAANRALADGGALGARSR